MGASPPIATSKNRSLAKQIKDKGATSPMANWLGWMLRTLIMATLSSIFG
ncbi:hypothetical protein LguiA_013318 [Lonicera macranthoides]